MAKIHPTSIIHPGAELGSDIDIGPWCTIGPKVRLGSRNRLISHVVIDGNTTIAEGNTFFPFSAIGMVPQDLKYKGEDTLLKIGKNNTIRESVTLNLGTVQGGNITEIGDGNLLMAYVHLGHDTRIGNGCVIANGVQLAGHVILEDYVTIGGVTGIGQFTRIGAHAYVAGHSALEKNLPPFCIAYGSRPVVIRGANIVGLKRRGFSAEAIQRISEVIKLWTRSDYNKEQCLAEIESSFGSHPECKQFLDFIKNSEYGVLK